jgi:hypothetical protein
MEALLLRLAVDGKRAYASGDHSGYLVSSDVLSAFVTKWRGNRDPDTDRVAEIREYAEKHPFVPVIYVALLDGKLQCYDGNHRREAFSQMDAPNAPNAPVVLDVLVCPNGESDVVREFISLNKTVPVSEVHLERCGGGGGGGRGDHHLEEILQLVRSYEAKYKAFRSTSHRCIAPNFNRDRFTDNILAIMRATGSSVREVAVALERLNELYNPSVRNADRDHPIVVANREMTPLSKRVAEKCANCGGLWLFARHQDIPVQDVAQQMMEMRDRSN